MALKPEKRQKKSEVLLHDEAIEAFKLWANTSDKTEY